MEKALQIQRREAARGRDGLGLGRPADRRADTRRVSALKRQVTSCTDTRANAR